MRTVADRPALAAQWHPRKNGSLEPTGISVHSRTRVWWKCPRAPDHQWRAAPGSRSAGTGCPFCANKKASVTNSLAALRPELAAQWHRIRNAPVRARDVVVGSNRSVWWQCPRNAAHEWRTAVQTRSKPLGTGCPFCAGLRFDGGAGSFAARHPDVAALWHPTKNGSRRPDAIGPSSNHKVWWRCRRDATHEWQSIVAKMAQRGPVCPMCAGRIVTTRTSLRAKHPSLARQWHATKNGLLRPDAVLPGTTRMVWWKCAAGPDHEWEMPVWHRVTFSKNCPFCSSRRLSVTNSLAAVEPRVARQWDATRNGSLSPREVRWNSKDVVHWKCRKGPDHEWTEKISMRTQRGTNCPFCAHRRLSITNCFATMYPRIAAQWHPKLNKPLGPHEIFPSSARPIWWRCQFGHSWSATAASRAASKSGCPTCASARRRRPAATRKVREAVWIPSGRERARRT